MLLGYWLFFFAVLLSGFVAILHFHLHGIFAILAFSALVSCAGIAWFIFLERASIGFKKLTPQIVSMYDERFWRHERYWKFTGAPFIPAFKGTPFASVISRLLGVRLGRRVFDDGCRFFDKSLIEVGDYANLNEGSTFQGHSLEEGVFKSDTIKIGSKCSIGCAAFVHYGVTMGDNVVLDPDSFLMKGEIVDADTVWRGNPARAIRGAVASQMAA